MTYTADPNDLNAAKLAQYDALIIHADHETITPEQEGAAGRHGGREGFLPLHAVSLCFQSSPAEIALVGAQSERHGRPTE